MASRSSTTARATFQTVPGSSDKPWSQKFTRRYRFVDAQLIDPKDGAIYQHVTIDVADGLIERMTKLGEGPSSADMQSFARTHDGATIVDLQGKWVIPGLIDCRVHLAAPPGEAGLHATPRQDAELTLLRQPHLLGQMLKRGFTTVRDCSGASPALRHALEEGLFPGPRLILGGRALGPTGISLGPSDAQERHGAPRSSCSVMGPVRIADGVEKCLQAAREELRGGADSLRIAADGPRGVLYTAEEITAIVRVATGAGTHVSAFANTPAAIQLAVQNGVSTIEHGEQLDEASARLIASKGAFLTPVMIPPELANMPQGSASLIRELADSTRSTSGTNMKRILQTADAVGVTLCYGSNCLGAMHDAQAVGLLVWPHVGLSALTVLQSATINAARLLRLEDKIGRLKEGSAADFLVLNANPLLDMQVLARPEKHLLAVIRAGRIMESRWTNLPRNVEQELPIE